MYVNPFGLGVGVTILAELAIFFIVCLIAYFKSNK